MAGRPYEVTDPTGPINVYGVAKRSGERYVSYLLEECFIVRTCALFGPVAVAGQGSPLTGIPKDDIRRGYDTTRLGAGGGHFADQLMRLPTEGEAYGFTDQIGSPTYAPDLAWAVAELLRVATGESACVRPEVSVYGFYHLVNEGACSRYEFAQEVLQAAGRTDVRLRPSSLREDQRAAQRPANSSLSTTQFTRITGQRMRSWKEAVADYVAAATAENRQSAR
jgi:dTDP-4-dehydrorhamnose reductase